MLIYKQRMCHVYLFSDFPHKKKLIWETQFIYFYSILNIQSLQRTVVQFINSWSLQVRREQISIIMHVTLLDYFIFADFSILEAAKHSPKQNMYNLPEKGQMIIFSKNEFSDSIAV